MSPLYCSSCKAFLDGMSEVCQYCGQDHSDEYDEKLENASNVLYCGDCGNYLGSLGGKFCDCGWNILK